MSWHTGTLSIRSDTQNPRNIWTINILILFPSQRNPMFQEISLHNILLRGHNFCCSVHPRPPSPRGAAGPQNRGRWQLRRAAVCCLRSRSPRQATGRTQRKEGEKNSENFGHFKSQNFWKFWPLKNPPWTSGMLWFWGCFDDIELVEKTAACGVLSKPCQHVSATNPPMIGTPHNLKIIALFCSFAPGISFNWPNKQWQEKETSVRIMRPAEIQLSHELTSEWKLRKPRNTFWILMGLPTYGPIRTLR